MECRAEHYRPTRSIRVRPPACSVRRHAPYAGILSLRACSVRWQICPAWSMQLGDIAAVGRAHARKHTRMQTRARRMQNLHTRMQTCTCLCACSSRAIDTWRLWQLGGVAVIGRRGRRERRYHALGTGRHGPVGMVRSAWSGRHGPVGMAVVSQRDATPTGCRPRGTALHRTKCCPTSSSRRVVLDWHDSKAY